VINLSYKEVIEGLYQRFLEIRKNVYTGIDDAFKLLREEPMDRIALAEVLTRLQSDIRVLIGLIDSIESHINKVDVEMLKQLPLPLVVIFALLRAFSEHAKFMKYDFELRASNLKYIANKLFLQFSFGGYIYSDNDIRIELYKEIASLLEHVKMLDIRIENELYKMGYSTVKHLPMVSVVDLITFHVNDWPGLNDKWVAAAVYLATLEVSVNTMCDELGIKADEFKKKLDKLVEYMKNYGIEVSRIEKDIVSRLYDYRNKVLHGGYIPKDDELAYILNVVPKFIQYIKDFRQKAIRSIQRDSVKTYSPIDVANFFVA